MKFNLLLLFVFSLPLGAIASTSTPLNHYLDATFVQVHSIRGTDSGDIIVLDGGKAGKFTIERSELSRALIQSLDLYTPAIEDRIAENHSKELKGPTLKEEIKEFVRTLPTEIGIGQGAVVELAKELGKVPTLFFAGLFVTTYPPYTVVTELLESAPLGPFHVFCHLFQALYFVGFNFLLDGFRDLRLDGGILLRDPQQMWELTHESLESARHYRKLYGTALMEVNDQVLNQKSFLKWLSKEYQFESWGDPVRRLGRSSIWMDFAEKFQTPERQSDSSTNGTSDPLLVQQDRVHAILLLHSLVRAEVNEAYREHKISKDIFIEARRNLGKILKRIAIWHQDKVILVRAFIVESRNARNTELDIRYTNILEQLEEVRQNTRIL